MKPFLKGKLQFATNEFRTIRGCDHRQQLRAAAATKQQQQQQPLLR